MKFHFCKTFFSVKEFEKEKQEVNKVDETIKISTL